MLRVIDSVVDDDVYIGGSMESAIPIELYEALLASFPTKAERIHYVHSRISVLLQEYFPKSKRFIDLHNKHISQKEKRLSKAISVKNASIFDDNRQLKLTQYTNLLKDFDELLKNAEAYCEKDWQNLIQELMVFLYPKYIRALDEVMIRGLDESHYKRLDFMLIDSYGYVDVMEIKNRMSKSSQKTHIEIIIFQLAN